MNSASTPAVPMLRLSSFYFAYYAALGAFNPYWGLYLKTRGQDVAAISILMSLWYATRIVAPSSWSYLATRSKRPVVWLRIGSLLSLSSFAVFAIPLDFSGLFVAMCVFCFVYNAIMPQFESITLSHLSGRSERYGRIRAWGSIGFILVVALFGVLFESVSVAHLPWLMLPLFAGMFAAACINDYGKPPTAGPSVDSGNFLSRLRRPEVIAFFVVALLMQISFGPFYTFYSIYLDELGYSASSVGLYWAIGIIFEIVVFSLSTWIFRRWSASTVLISSLIAASVRWAIMALWPESTILMALAQLAHALSFAAFFAASMQFLVLFFPGRFNGHAQGIFYGFSSGIGGVIGALLSGLAWHHGGGELAFLLASGVAVVALIVAWIWLRQSALIVAD